MVLSIIVVKTLSVKIALGSLFNIQKKKMIGQETRDLIDKLLLERVSLAGITRVTGVSEQWLQTYVNALYKAVPKEVKVWSKKKEG